MNTRERFNIVRLVVVFGLGVWIIVDAVTDNVSAVPKLVIGMIMVGVLPIENFALWRPIQIPGKQSVDRCDSHRVESKPEATASDIPQPPI